MRGQSAGLQAMTIRQRKTARKLNPQACSAVEWDGWGGQ